MKDSTLYFHILDQIDEIGSRITLFADEQRLVTEQINAGSRDATILEKDNRLQAEIARLIEQLDKLLHEAQIILGKD